LNTRFDPFGLRLKGWSKDMNEKKDDLDDCFHRLHDKYSSKTAIEPELELAFAFFGGCFMYHLQNAAESYGELGTMMSAIAGGPPAKKPAAAARAPQQQQVMTNMPLFTQPDYTQPSYSIPQQPQVVQQPQQPRVGKSGRRIMNAPPIPGGQTGIDVMSMMAGAAAAEPPDLPPPNVMDVPIQVGGYATAVSSPVRNEPTRNAEPAAPRSAPPPPRSSAAPRSAPPPPRSSAPPDGGARPRRGAPANGSTPKREGRGIQI
jgi:hypothetical protein